MVESGHSTNANLTKTTEKKMKNTQFKINLNAHIWNITGGIDEAFLELF